MKWDTAVALAYAAEQLFLAGQLLTSDMVPLEKSVPMAFDRYISALLEHRKFLPAEVAGQLREAQDEYKRSAGRLDRARAQHLCRRVLKLLDQVRAVLTRISPGAQADAA